MFWWRSFVALGVGIGLGVGLDGTSVQAIAETKISPGAEIQANERVVKEVLAAFARAEEALKAQDLGALMATYSKDYEYHGMKKNDLREVWREVLERYRRISTHHIFSKIVVVVEGNAPRAEVTCTGGLWATSESTGQRENIDSWFQEVHRLIYEDGAWRIRGHTGEGPNALRFGVAHPFF